MPVQQNIHVNTKQKRHLTSITFLLWLPLTSCRIQNYTNQNSHINTDLLFPYYYWYQSGPHDCWFSHGTDHAPPVHRCGLLHPGGAVWRTFSKLRRHLVKLHVKITVQVRCLNKNILS